MADITLSNGTVITAGDLSTIATEVKKLIAKDSKDPSQYEAVNSLANLTTLPALLQAGPVYTLVRVPVELLKGVDGQEVELRTTSEAMEWRLGDGEWQTLLTLDALREQLTGQLMSYKQVVLTQAEFDALETKDSKTMYYIIEE